MKLFITYNGLIYPFYIDDMAFENEFIIREESKYIADALGFDISFI